VTTLAEKLSRDHAALSALAPPGLAGVTRRRAALEALLQSGLPTSREENWRYANLRALERASFAPTPTAAGDERAWRALLPPPVPGFTRILVVDGVRDAAARTGAEAASESASDVAHESAPESVPAPPPADGRFALLNEAFALDAFAITTTGGTRTPQALELVYLSSGTGAAYPRARIEVAPGTALRLLERHVGNSAGALTNGYTRVTLGPDAELDHYRLQTHGNESTWIDTLEVVQGRGSRYALHHYGVGARSARSTIRIRLTGPEASVAVHAATIAERVQVEDTYARIEHAAPRTRSLQNFRAIASGRGRAAFNGHVVVQHGAAGSESRQSLRSLIAGTEAEVDARPQLEIYTDDVKCSHGATAGKLDETMLFYLLSRGLTRDTAQSLLKWAFLEDTVAHIGDPALRATIEAVLADHLKDPTITAGRRE